MASAAKVATSRTRTARAERMPRAARDIQLDDTRPQHDTAAHGQTLLGQRSDYREPPQIDGGVDGDTGRPASADRQGRAELSCPAQVVPWTILAPRGVVDCVGGPEQEQARSRPPHTSRATWQQGTQAPRCPARAPALDVGSSPAEAGSRAGASCGCKRQATHHRGRNPPERA